MTLDLNAALNTAETLAKSAGALLHSAMDLPRTLTYKSAIDLVTEFDPQSEALIVAGLRDAYPDHFIVAEEGSGTGVPTDPGAYCWYIDPLDGTTNFTHHIPHYAVSIALTLAGEPTLGVIYDPSMDECFTAIKGGGAHLNGKPIHVSQIADMEQAMIISGFPYDKWTNPSNNSEEWNVFVLRTQGMLCTGSAALDLSYVAAGRAEGYFEAGLKPWDLMAGALLVQEAGGRISNYRGLMDGVYEGKQIVSSNTLVHERMLTILMMGTMAPRPNK